MSYYENEKMKPAWCFYHKKTSIFLPCEFHVNEKLDGSYSYM